MHAGISLRQIETFYWVARLGSFSEAAAQLNTTQPAVSNRIRELETHLNVQVFNRGGRTVTPTTAGRALLDVAERFLELGDELLACAGAERELSGVIRIGAADTVALTWLPRLISDLSRRYPRLSVELFVDLSLYIQEKLAEGDLDIGFLVGTAPGPEFVEIPFGAVRNAWMCSGDLGLAGRPVSPAELAERPILTHSRGSHLHRVVRRWFLSAGIRRTRIHGCSSLATMIEMTAAGLGASILPPTLVARNFPRHDLIEIDVAPALEPTVFSCIYAERTPSAIYSEIVAVARQKMAEDSCFDPA